MWRQKREFKRQRRRQRKQSRENTTGVPVLMKGNGEEEKTPGTTKTGRESVTPGEHLTTPESGNKYSNHLESPAPPRQLQSRLTWAQTRRKSTAISRLTTADISAAAPFFTLPSSEVRTRRRPTPAGWWRRMWRARSTPPTGGHVHVTSTVWKSLTDKDKRLHRLELT